MKHVYLRQNGEDIKIEFEEEVYNRLIDNGDMRLLEYYGHIPVIAQKSPTPDPFDSEKEPAD